MAKRSNRRPVRHEKGQKGCMWGLISMFDFRQGRSTQRLLSDSRRGNKIAVGLENSVNKLDKLTSSGDSCRGTIDSEEKTLAAGACKTSVKKLLEEEMFGEQVANKEVDNTEVETRQFDSAQGDIVRKNRKRKNNTRKKSSDKSRDMDASQNFVSEICCQHISEKQNASNLDINHIMEEFCRRINQKRTNCGNHDQPAEGHKQPNQKCSRFEERLSEAIKFLVSQKLNRNQLTEEGELQASKEVIDALEILILDEELFLELLRDPNSLLVKYAQNLPDAQVKDEESKPLTGCNFSELELVDARQSSEPVDRKPHNFFRRKQKSQERELSDGNNISQASNKIVILKPGPTCLQTPETRSTHGSSPESQYTIRLREPNEKVGSYFFLAEIKRKLKHAMGREQHRIPADVISERFLGERQNSRDSGGVKEYIGMNSPTKDHFYIERIARPSGGVKKGEKSSKLKGSELGKEYETTDFSRQRVSNIYIEAKKHLSEIITNGDENVDRSSIHVSKTLGRILSVPEYNLSPPGSPGRNLESSLVAAQMRFSGSEKVWEVNEINQQNHVSHLSQASEDSQNQLCTSDNKSNDEIQGDNAVPNNFDTCVKDDKEYQNLSSAKDEMRPEGTPIIVKATEMMVLEESKLGDVSFETSDSSTTRDDKNVICEVIDEKRSECLEQGSSEEDQLPFSPSASPSNSLIIKKVEGFECIQERPSPVSVLEPIFANDFISPESIRSRSGETSIQPLRIEFEIDGFLDGNQVNHVKTCMDDKESTFEHVKAVMQASSFNWDELYIRLLSSDLLLNPLLLDEVEYSPNQLCQDQKLLFDCINEVLIEVCGYYIGSPGASFVKPNIRPIPNMKYTIQEVWQGVYWHLLPMPLPRNLDQIVRKDMAKTGTWMDLRLDTDCIGVEMGEAILEDLVEDTIISYRNEGL